MKFLFKAHIHASHPMLRDTIKKKIPLDSHVKAKPFKKYNNKHASRRKDKKG